MAVAKRPINSRKREGRSNRSVPASEPVATVLIIRYSGRNPVVVSRQDLGQLQYQPSVPSHHDPPLAASSASEDDLGGALRSRSGQTPELLIALLGIGNAVRAVDTRRSGDVGLNPARVNAGDDQI